MDEKISLGLFGFGCVGQGLFDVLNYSEGLKAKVNKICVLNRDKKRSLDKSFFTYSADEILNNDENDVIVELINDPGAAYGIVDRSLNRSKSVVSANKKMIAENFSQLFRKQIETGSSLLYEGACGGSIPIIRTLEEYYDNEPLKEIRGILNGSSNFILTKMQDENLTFDSALKLAREKGFAEADPYLDISGLDSKYKLCIAAVHAFGILLKPEHVLNLGIGGISPFDIEFASQKNAVIKLLIYAEETGGRYRIYSMPFFIDKSEILAGIRNEFNAVEIKGAFSGKQVFIGKGAGSHPTGSAVLSDISALTYDYKYGYKKLLKNIKSNINKPEYDDGLIDTDFEIKLFIRYKERSDFEELDISDIEESYSSEDNNYIVARARFGSLFGLKEKAPGSLFIAAL